MGLKVLNVLDSLQTFKLFDNFNALKFELFEFMFILE